MKSVEFLSEGRLMMVVVVGVKTAKVKKVDVGGMVKDMVVVVMVMRTTAG